MIHRFASRDWVLHKPTNQHGQITKAYKDGEIAMYEVNVPQDQTTCTFVTGAVPSDWADSDVALPTNPAIPK